MSDPKPTPPYGRFHIPEVAVSFPDTAETTIVDTYLTDTDSASSRVFRAYTPGAPHYHAHSDEHLYVLSGRGIFWMETPDNAAPFAPGDFVFFKRNTIHAMPEIHEGPVIFLAVDTPRRQPTDVIFVNPEDGTPQSFVSQKY